MNPKKIKVGIGVPEILAIVFSLLGGIFTAIAVVFALNPDAVQAHSTGNAALFPLIFGAIGVPFLLLGIIFAVISLRRRTVLKRVAEGGYYVMATVADIRPNFSVQVNGVCPYVLECHYQDTLSGALHVFRSRNLFFYPGELAGRQVRVYVDRTNMDHYYVDVDSLVPEVEVH